MTPPLHALVVVLFVVIGLLLFNLARPLRPARVAAVFALYLAIVGYALLLRYAVLTSLTTNAHATQKESPR